MSIPIWIYRPIRFIKRFMSNFGLRVRSGTIIPDARGDRDIEWSWIASRIRGGPGEALDFGSGGSCLALTAAQAGFNVTAVDLGDIRWYYKHPHLRFISGDILTLSLPENHFDLIINCSTVEHVGLVGRYGVLEDRPDGDLEAMTRLYTLMKPSARMLLTIPVGKDAVFAPLHRVYGRERLPRLLDRYVVEDSAFWIKGEDNRWSLCDEETTLNSAGSWDPLRNVYVLGCFVMRKPD